MKKLVLIILGISILSIITAQNFTPLQELLPKGEDRYTDIRFGASVAVYGNYAVVGAQGYNNSRGRAYIYRYSNAEWKLISTLKSPDDKKSGYFGHTVDINRDFVAVSALDNNNNGTVFLFKRDNNSWNTDPDKVITLNSVAGYSKLGDVLCLSDDDLVISCEKSASASKSVFIYSFNGLVWSSNPVIKDTDISYSAERGTGRYIAINSTEIFIGGNNKLVVFTKDNSWVNTSVTEISNPDISSDSRFGYAIAVSNNTLVVGDMTKDSDVAANAGIVYLYTKKSGSWNTNPILLKADTDNVNELRFGKSVAIHNNIIVVGAANSEGLANNNEALFIFKKSSNSEWSIETESQVIVSKPDNNILQCGWSVDIFGDKLITGVPDLNNEDKSYVRFFYNIGTDFIELPSDDSEAKPYYDNEEVVFGYNIDAKGDYIAVGRRVTSGLDIYPAVDMFEYNNARLNYRATLSCNVTDISDEMNGVCYASDFVALSAAGEVYIFNKPTDKWGSTNVCSELAKPIGASDRFGNRTVFNNNVLVVADPLYNGGKGALFLYNTVGQNWSGNQPYATLEPSGIDKVKLGSSVSFIDGLIVAGAVDAVISGVKTGAAYVFTNDGNSWSSAEENQILYVPDANNNDGFGNIVACANDIVAVGSSRYNESKGAIVLFKKVVNGDGHYSRVAKLEYTESLPEIQFGSSIAINGDVIAVACKGNNTIPSAVLFKRDNDSWSGNITEWQTIGTYNGSALTDYTSSVAFMNNILVTGNPYGDFYGSYSGAINSYAQFYNLESSVVNGSGVVSPVSSKVIYGDDFMFEITPDPGMSIDETLFNGVSVNTIYNELSDTYLYSVNSVDADGKLEVSFIAGHTLNVKISGNGAVDEERVILNDGDSHTFVFTPAEYYYIHKAEFNGEPVQLIKSGDNYEYSVNNVTSDGFFEIVFSPVLFNINISESILGQIIVDDGINTIGVDDRKRLIITPNQGYDLARIFINDIEVTNFDKSEDSYEYTLYKTKTDLNIEAEFYAIEYNIVINNGDNGSVSKIGNKTITIQDKTHITITPDIGYTISGITLNSDDITNKLKREGRHYIYILQNVDDDIHIDIQFSIVEYNMLITYSNGGGVEPAGNYATNVNNSGGLKLIPDNGFIAEEIDVNGTTISDEPTFYNLIKAYEEGAYMSRLMVHVTFKQSNSTDIIIKDVNKLRIEENPVKSLLRIDLPVTLKFREILITSLSGNVVLSVNEYSPDGIDVSSIKQGVYIVVVVSDEEQYVGKFIKE